MTRSLIVSVGFQQCAFTSTGRNVIANHASWAGDWPQSCCCERTAVRLDILRTQRLAWAWRYTGVQEVNFGSRLVAVLAMAQSRHDLGDIQLGGNIWSMWYMCMNAGARTWGENG